jgi:hypothetical protein
VVRSVVGRKQPVAQEIVRGARPRFVGVASEVRAHGDHEFPGMGPAGPARGAKAVGIFGYR